MVVNLGIIGLGTIGKFVLKGAIQHPNYRVVAVYDINPPELDHALDISVTDSAQELIDRSDIDVIYIGTPPKFHIDYCHQVLDASKILWCEKPLSVELNESEILVNRIVKNNLIGAVNLSLASNPIISKLSTVIEDIAPELHKSIEMNFHFSSWPRDWQSNGSSWLTSKEQGGFLREVFSHFAFLHHRIYGSLELISSEIEYDSTTGEESYIRATYRSNGIPVRLTCTIGGSAPEKNEWTLYAQNRSIRYTGWNTIQVGDNEGWSTLEVINVASIPSQLNEILKLVNGKSNKLATFIEGFEVQKVVENTILQATK